MLKVFQSHWCVYMIQVVHLSENIWLCPHFSHPCLLYRCLSMLAVDARGEDQQLRAQCIGLLLHSITTILWLLQVPSITLKAAVATCHLILTSCDSISLHPHRALMLFPNTPYAHRSSQSHPRFLHLLLTTPTAPLQFRFRALTLT